jgi:hypothetical protein
VSSPIAAVFPGPDAASRPQTAALPLVTATTIAKQQAQGKQPFMVKDTPDSAGRRKPTGQLYADFYPLAREPAVDLAKP